MKILLDSCTYNCQNVGDLAMFTVAVTRLRELWPRASISVITNAPDIIRQHAGSVSTVPVRGRRLLLEEELLGPARRWLPGRIRERWDRFESGLRLQQPGLFQRSLQLKSRWRGRDTRDAQAFLAAVESADLLVVNGAGIITDAFKDNALGILATLDLVSRRRVPTAIMGQGFGPIEDRELRQRAADVLPRVSLIGAREARTSPALLAELGVASSNVRVTGDDAIELAYAGLERRRGPENARPPCIGVNVRVAPYAAVDRELLGSLEQALAVSSGRHGASLVPVPIAHHGGGMDVETLRHLLGGSDDGGAALTTPQQVIERVGQCRVVVTGSYHGAVFALAQGIPVVALARSEYYVNKMAGVAGQFGAGCEIVRLDTPASTLVEQLTLAVDRAWSGADAVRTPLLAAAASQIAAGRRAYQDLLSIVSATSRQAA
jgi:polysaccharide pyruvyl transferase WcaK-like protein